jgi:hypothetical protein
VVCLLNDRSSLLTKLMHDGVSLTTLLATPSVDDGYREAEAAGRNLRGEKRDTTALPPGFSAE